MSSFSNEHDDFANQFFEWDITELEVSKTAVYWG